jgi:hypothetical protein
MHDSTLLNHLPSTLAPLALALFGACTINVGDNVIQGHDGRDDDEGVWEQCYEQYDECLEEADGEMQPVKLCGEQLDACTAEDAVTTGESDDADADAPATEICASLHQSCVAEADSLADTQACEALFDHCAHPGECHESCSQDCPEAALGQCLGDYAGCVAAAAKDYEVDACNVVFDGCVAEHGADACLPPDDAHIDACLAEHALCTACADDDVELAACRDIFDACVSPPM